MEPIQTQDRPISAISPTRRLIRERNRAARLRHEAINLSQDNCDLNSIVVDLEDERDFLEASLNETLSVLNDLYNTLSPALRGIADHGLRQEIVTARHFLRAHGLLEDSHV